MMKVRIENSTMEKLMKAAGPLMTKDNCISFDFGVEAPEAVEGTEAKMVTKVTITSESDQLEMEFYTTVPAEIERPLSECSRENPLEKAVVSAEDFKMIVEALATYKADFLAETDATSIMLCVEGVAEMPINKVNPGSMKAVIPHRENSTNKELWDPDLVMVGMYASAFAEAVKPVSSQRGEIEDGMTKFVNIAVQDTEMKYVEVEDAEGKKIKKPVANSFLQVAGGNGHMFANAVLDVFSKKGCGKDVLDAVPGEVKAGVESPIITFVKGEDGSLNATAVAYEKFKEEYDKARGLVTDKRPFNPNYFQFALPVDGFMKIVALANAEPSGRISLVVGKKYVQATFSGLGCTYLTVQQPIEGMSICNMYGLVANQFKGKDAIGSVTVDSKELQNAIKLSLVYEKDQLVSNYPVELSITKDNITVVRGKAKANVNVISYDTSIDSLLIGLAPRMLKGCLTGLPAGNVTLYYQIAKPVVVLTSGGNDIGYNKSGILATGFAPDVIEDRKKKAQESLKKAEEDKAKKEAEAKKKEA